MREKDILNFMMIAPEQSFTDRQVSRALDRDLFRKDPHWARPLLETLVSSRKLDQDARGYFFPLEAW
jgi:hypothetical protein